MNETITMGMKTVSRIAAPVQMPRLKRVAAYARVSMGKDAMLHSLAAQVSYYSDLIQRKTDRRRKIEIFLQMLEEQMECIGFDPYTFVALVDRVVIGQDRKLEFIFRNGMKYEYTIVG